MKVEQIQCPACGADLDIPEGRDTFFCQYCGASVHVDDEVQRKEVIHRTIDEAEIVKSNNEIEIKRLEMEDFNRRVEIYRQDSKKDLIGVFICFGIVICMVIVCWITTH